MTVVDGPPAANHLVVRVVADMLAPAQLPRLVGTNEVDHADARLEVQIGRHILVVSRGGDVVSEGKTVPRVLEVHVQQTLIGTIEGDAPLGHSHHGIIVAHVRGENHDTGVEDVRPADIRGGREGVRQFKELIRSTIGDNVSIDVNDLPELSLLPEGDLGESRVQIRTIHEIEVGRVIIADTLNRDDVVVDRLHISQHMSP